MSQNIRNTNLVKTPEILPVETSHNKRELDDSSDRQPDRRQRSKNMDATVIDVKELPDKCFLCQRNIFDIKDR